MFIEFSVGNYRSFREKVTFSLLATNLSAKKESQSIDDSNKFMSPIGSHLLKSAAIYGANASGKSNFIKAFGFMRNFVINSSKDRQANEPIEVEPFLLDSDFENKPSFFEVAMIIEGDLYWYGFEANDKEIVSEWLSKKSSSKPRSRESQLFRRENKEIIFNSKNFKEGSKKAEDTRNNALFLSKCAQDNGRISIKLISWFQNIKIHSGLSDSSRILTHHMMDIEVDKEKIVSLLNNLDLGFNDVSTEREKISLKGSSFSSNPSKVSPNSFVLDVNGGEVVFVRAKTHHQKSDSSDIQIFDLDQHESEGTKKIFALAGIWLDTLAKGNLLVIDEFDARLHPKLTKQLLQLFNSNETNPKNAQIIFVTHDTNLLSNKLLRRDQIWFAEKDKNQATKLYSLAEYKVRNDASYEADYIEGRYGAVPFIGDLSHIFEATHG
ncbi:MAG: ATP-binding protein [Anaerolineae bacterium]|nr:ATP-binding protein [Anaerolineae bacterium]